MACIAMLQGNQGHMWETLGLQSSCKPAWQVCQRSKCNMSIKTLFEVQCGTSLLHHFTTAFQFLSMITCVPIRNVLHQACRASTAAWLTHWAAKDLTPNTREPLPEKPRATSLSEHTPDIHSLNALQPTDKSADAQAHESVQSHTRPARLHPSSQTWQILTKKPYSLHPSHPSDTAGNIL